mgnify:FL=1
MHLEMKSCIGCKRTSNHLLATNYHTLVCTACGVENPGYLTPADNTAWNSVLVPTQTYTRIKRFRKYLARASKAQNASSVPEQTWQYLFAHGPYKTPGAIVRTLKAAGKRIKKKCYDSLPLFCEQLADIRVPSLTNLDKFRANAAFKKLDTAYSKGEPFVSYLFALEYILGRIGRSDVLPFINKIQCRKRRHRYKMRLDKIYT